jgi:hypothetical protein
MEFLESRGENQVLSGSVGSVPWQLSRQPKQRVRQRHQTYLVILDLNDGLLLDESDIRLEIYAALCPSSPCPLGLALEDIEALSVTSQQVRLAISLPNVDTPNHVDEVMASLRAQLQDKDSSLRVESLEDQVVRAELLRVVDNADALGHRPALQGLVRLTNKTSHPHKRVLPQRADSHKSLKERKSSALHCITILLAIFLVVSVAQIIMERLGRWFMSSESDSANLQVDEDSKSIQAEHDFAVVSSVLEILKVPLASIVSLAVTMYIVQARAKELTRGLGDPPKWVQGCMIAIIVAKVLAIFSWAAMGFMQGRGGHVMHLRMHSLVHWKPNAILVSIISMCRLAIFVCETWLFACVLTMSPDECVFASEGTADKLWGNQSPPSVSMEHKICLFLCAHYALVSNLEWK